ncbi:hypothetical protein S7711_06148 [Stachybotrys chartarum IBT 7711]|uniref:lytic cellulose monooxygenase (C4-dehydrogenating) n=1 Tax=Stachybotrys chartarum (strain CBS 109288 / IBT 7711) TaxID=1280523 RepID=A0A084B696_STACB|nr:hypothetical protein S7711_06148 [Stachybotrys chartarum IBT 7711]KFA56576.1 hypothetical protein S40293_01175 [Stachybotrys chartarum IBT 40293]KFA80088.1 hypothetical protein S40288_09811 [Stachybotrys chartarum IBT 40288]
MKFSSAIVAALAPLASAHYWFDTNIVNGATQPAYRYVRRSTRPTLYNPIKWSFNPPADIRDGSFVDGPDIRCNQGAGGTGSRSEVLSVTAGSEVRVQLAAGSGVQHPGPTLVYMSRAPGDVRNYDGSGDWFKIYHDAVCRSSGDFTTDAWCSWNVRTLAARIPANTPNGEYLVRFEHIGVHRSHVSQPEHYVGCLQVRVTGGGNGTPGPLVRFPGAYSRNDPYVNFSVYGGHRAFTIPGPAVWNGSGGTTNPNPNPNPSCSPLYGQCGGQGWTGPTCCSSGTCRATNEWYSQCT